MRPIARFENRYQITQSGDVINLANNTTLTPTQNPNGYYKVGLADGKGGHTQLLVHRLVALHFLPNPYEHSQVNHKDGNKSHNHMNNLEWCTSGQNTQHALKTGLRPGYMSADDKEKYMWRVLNGGIRVVDLAQEIGRGQESLSKMLRETAVRLGVHANWQEVMKENRRDTAIRNLSKVNN